MQASYRRLIGLFIILCVSFLQVAKADVDVMPMPTSTVVASCIDKGYRFKKSAIIFEASAIEAEQKLYLIKNKTDQTLWLNHPVNNASASAGWASRLNFKHWSAIAIAEIKPFVLTCSVMLAGGKLQMAPCQKVLQVCQITKPNFNRADARGTYWVAEDLSFPELTAAIIKRGIKW